MTVGIPNRAPIYPGTKPLSAFQDAGVSHIPVCFAIVMEDPVSIYKQLNWLLLKCN